MEQKNNEIDLLRFATIGSVDDGKSTLIGRLLHDSKNLYEDHLNNLKKVTKLKTAQDDDLEFAYLLDGLKAEREQGITIDVAYRYFATEKRRFVIADCPGHEQYTRNMFTGISKTDLVIMLIDARKGVLGQTRRHSLITGILGIPNVIVAINKMDLVNYSEDVFNKTAESFLEMSKEISLKNVHFIPICATAGDNLIQKSKQMPWYEGLTILQLLETINCTQEIYKNDFRFSIQTTIRPNQYFRGFAGTISSGKICEGDEVLILPSNQRTHIKTIESYQSILDSAGHQMSVTLTLKDEIDAGRGSFIVKANEKHPQFASNFSTHLMWMSDTPISNKIYYLMKIANQWSKVRLTAIDYEIDIESFNKISKEKLVFNALAKVQLQTQRNILADKYLENKETGCFILVDPETNQTVAAGTILEIMQEQKNIFPIASQVSRLEREAKNNHKGMTYWFTGLSGAGKTTIAHAFERALFQNNYQVIVIDGDTIRYSLNKDLSFDDGSRLENNRRVAELSKLLNEAGFVVIASLISPLEKYRRFAKEIIGQDSFHEIFISASLAVCESRDPKGLYKKARQQDLGSFTGISSLYEIPSNPFLVLETETTSLENCVKLLLEKHKELHVER